jgi:hypothetical protein
MGRLFIYTLRRGGMLPAISLMLSGILGGCAGSNGPEVVMLPSTRYSEAFDSAVEAVRKQGMPASLRDRRQGVILTEPRYAGSLLEPWRTDNANFAQANENTLNFQRRRTRFEFAPVGYQPPVTAAEEGLTGPDVVAGNLPITDLTSFDGELELRVWVYVERAFEPGVKRDPWSRSLTTKYRTVDSDGKTQKSEGLIWTPVNRDRAYERRLLLAVQESMGLSEPPESPESRPPG